MAGAFMRNVQVRLESPAAGADNTSSTATLSATLLDPLRRSGAVVFQVDRTGMFASPFLATSANVNGTGWAATPLSWATAAIGNGWWYWRAQSTGVRVGAGPSVPAGRYAVARQFRETGGAGIPRSLYLYVNRAMPGRLAGQGANARSLYLYVNRAMYSGVLVGGKKRSLYLYVNRAMYPGAIRGGLSRSLYLYESPKDGEVFPWLSHISPTEQYAGGQVALYGDGFGQYLDATPGATITVSGTSGGNVAANVRDGTAAQWLATNGAASWIRFTWGSAKRIVAVVLEGATTDSWGVPRFRFDDASSQDGAVTVPVPGTAKRDAQFPIGSQRQAYWLATPKVSTYVEVAIASGGFGTNRGLTEAWVIEEAVTPDLAELSRAWLNLDLPTVTDLGIVSWLNRSPNWHPANGGIEPLHAGVVTLPSTAVSGLITVQEEI